jgi:hypothetical protein
LIAGELRGQIIFNTFFDPSSSDMFLSAAANGASGVPATNSTAAGYFYGALSPDKTFAVMSGMHSKLHVSLHSLYPASSSAFFRVLFTFHYCCCEWLILQTFLRFRRCISTALLHLLGLVAFW